MKEENNIPKKSADVKYVFDKYAVQYQQKYMDLHPFHDSFDFFSKNINKSTADILELGCGPGNITQYLLNKNPTYNILGIDLAKNMIALAKKNNPAAEFQVMDCRDINSLSQKFDGIMAGFCLPYLSKAEALQLIDDATALLHPKGVIYISTMEDDYANSEFVASSTDDGEELFIHYHQADYICDCLKKNGFQIIELQRMHHIIEKGQPSKDMIIIAVKGHLS